MHAEILRLAREAGIQRNASRIDPATKHGEIAGQISTYREQVARELSAWPNKAFCAMQAVHW